MSDETTIEKPPVQVLEEKTSALSEIIETGAGLSEGALTLAGQLHVLNESMVEKGISIVELLATLAKNFAGVHL